MVRLDNMTVSNGNASCRFYPEDSEQYGTLVIDISSGELVKYTKPENGCSNVYIAHARSKLHALILDNKELPDEAFSIWY